MNEVDVNMILLKCKNLSIIVQDLNTAFANTLLSNNCNLPLRWQNFISGIMQLSPKA